jgi:hypothetical protein
LLPTACATNSEETIVHSETREAAQDKYAIAQEKCAKAKKVAHGKTPGVSN